MLHKQQYYENLSVRKQAVILLLLKNSYVYFQYLPILDYIFKETLCKLSDLAHAKQKINRAG